MELVMKAHKWTGQPLSQFWMISEKLDGMRCLWLPQTQGKPIESCPLYFPGGDSGNQGLATGLWTLGGKPIFAPEWWYCTLPTNMNLDGELWCGRGGFQKTMSIVRGLREKVASDERWQDIKYMLYDAPTSCQVFLPREVRIRASKMQVPDNTLRLDSRFNQPYTMSDFQQLTFYTPYADIVKQTAYTDNAALEYMLEHVVGMGGEGLMLRHKMATWFPERSHKLLKVKPAQDAEGVVVGFTEGKGRLEGKVGALIINNGSCIFELAGLTDEERGKGYFQIGETITYKYRELTQDGKPKEARYMRRRVEE